MQKSPIQWTDATWNPAIGCRRVSAGCANCYAERLIALRMSKNPKLPMYHDIARVTEGDKPQFTGNRRLLPDRLDEPLRARKGRKIFICDMGDLFFEGHPFEDIAAVFGVMAAAHWHTFQVLTKRPERALAFFEWIGMSHIRRSSDLPHPAVLESVTWAQQAMGNERRRPPCRVDSHTVWPLPNVWIGVSVEDQAAADRRIPMLLRIPAALRFLSCEPLLEVVDVSRYMWPVHAQWPAEYATPEAAKAAGEQVLYRRQCLVSVHARFVDWVICGGESGPNARPFDLAWARCLRDQCRAAGVPFFMKQVGSNPRVSGHEGYEAFDSTYPNSCRRLSDSHGGDPAEWPEDLRVREFPRVA